MGYIGLGVNVGPLGVRIELGARWFLYVEYALGSKLWLRCCFSSNCCCCLVPNSWLLWLLKFCFLSKSSGERPRVFNVGMQFGSFVVVESPLVAGSLLLVLKLDEAPVEFEVADESLSSCWLTASAGRCGVPSSPSSILPLE